jgi:hypothetical protein
MWRLIAIACMASVLASCEGSQIDQTDVMGEYHADVPAGTAKLVIKPDCTWEYRIEGSPEFVRSGKWEPEPGMSTPSTRVITLDRFEFGFPLSDMDPQKPSFWPAQFSKDSTGKARACILDGEICFKHL